MKFMGTGWKRMIKPRMEWATSYFSCPTQKCHNQMDMFVANYPRISQQYTIGALLCREWCNPSCSGILWLVWHSLTRIAGEAPAMRVRHPIGLAFAILLGLRFCDGSAEGGSVSAVPRLEEKLGGWDGSTPTKMSEMDHNGWFIKF
jgi:hypothetical protein